MKEKGVTYEGVNGVKYDLNNDPMKRKKNKRTFIIVAISMITLLVVMILLITSFYMKNYAPKKDASEIKAEMTAYLKNRYEMEFVIEKPNLAGNAGFGRAWYADAHPKDNQSLTFGVAQDGNSYDDNYLHELWTSQGKPEVEALAKSIYGENINLDFYFYYYDDQLELNFDELKNLSYSDLINNHGPNLSCKIDCDIFLEENNIDKQLQAENIVKLCNEYFDRYSIGNRGILLQYVDKKYKDEYLERKRQEYRSSSDMQELYDERIMINRIRMFDDEVINAKKENVVKWFEY